MKNNENFNTQLSEIYNRFYETHKKLIKNQFQQDYESPWRWMAIALSLKEASDILAEEFIKSWNYFTSVNSGTEYLTVENPTEEQVIRLVSGSGFDKPYFLLMGYAFENILKANLIIDYPESIQDGVFSKKFLGHNLIKLCSEGIIELSHDEKELLGYITEYSLWKGRYPIPQKAEHIYPNNVDEFLNKPSEIYLDKIILDRIDTLFNKILSIVYRKSPPENNNSQPG